jgi:hypothetical protein
MAGKYGPSSVTMTLEDGPGGTARALTAFITGGLTVNKSSEMAETTALGDSAKAYTPIGITSAGENISITGIWDTTGTTGTHAVLAAVDDGPQDDTREAVIVFGDSKTATIQTRLISYSVIASNDNIQTFAAELQVTGAVVWS